MLLSVQSLVCNIPVNPGPEVRWLRNVPHKQKLHSCMGHLNTAAVLIGCCLRLSLSGMYDVEHHQLYRLPIIITSSLFVLECVLDAGISWTYNQPALKGATVLPITSYRC